MPTHSGKPGWFLRCRASNGSKVWQSETYPSKWNAQRAAQAWLAAAADLAEYRDVREVDQ